MNAISFTAPLQRFAWKEYRTLRGFWLAVLGLGLLLDWFVGVALISGTDFVLVRLYVALGAATLYAAGAASILFSLEHEDQTYDFLRGLPATWRAAFAGKLLVALLSSLALAAVLVGVAFIVGSGTPGAHQTPAPFDVLGVAIFEAVAWGTLFSQLIKRPLAAAITTLAVGALAVNLAVNFAGGGPVASTDPTAYANATPVRLAVVVAVLGLSVVVGRRWLADGGISQRGSEGTQSGWLGDVRRVVCAAKGVVFANRYSRHGMTGLLWQTWRESWRRLWFPIACGLGWIGVSLLLGAAGAGQWGHTTIGNCIAPFGVLLIPALYGALAFSTDQRRGQVRFLAEHAAAPRYVWLSRHIVWLGALVTLCVVAALTIILIGIAAVQSHARSMLFEHEIAGQVESMYSLQLDILSSLTNFRSGAGLLASGSLAAYGMGQVCSMLLRSEILAGFAALLLAVVLGSWVAALYAWQLSGTIFLLPLAAGTMLATWLRASDWIVGRNSAKRWLWPIAVLAVAVAFVGLMLPTDRIKQIGGLRSPIETSASGAAPSADALARDKDRKEEAAATADMYLKAWTMYSAPPEAEPLAPWNKAEFMEPAPGGIDEKLIPKDQREAFDAAFSETKKLWADQHAAALKMVLAATERPTCQFDFNMTSDEVVNSKISGMFWSNRQTSTYGQMESLQRELATWGMDVEKGTGIEIRNVNVPFEHLYAALRMSHHLISGQPTVIVCQQFETQQQIYRDICRWAMDKGRTKEELKASLKQLASFQVWPTPPDTYMVEQRLIREVLVGKEPPVILSDKSPPVENYLAFMANRLPWERERAIRANVLATTYDANAASNIVHCVASTKAGQGVPPMEQLRPDFPNEAYTARYPAAATSYLFAMEYRARVLTKPLYWAYCDAEACRRAAMIEIALVLFRGDHDEYPATLAELAPDYLEQEPLDPYSMQSFAYLPRGLDLVLRQIGTAQANVIKPFTPFFWSVGRYNERVRRQNDDSRRAFGPEADESPKSPPGEFYMLAPSDTFQPWSTIHLLFTLPE